jgi:two-component system, sporulation sensor kinase E
MNMGKSTYGIDCLEQQLMQNVAIMDIPCLLVHHSGRIVDSNSAFLALSMYKKEELKDQNILTKLSPSTSDLKHLEKQYHAKRSKLQFTWLDKEGESHHSYIQPVFFPDEMTYPAYAMIQFNIPSTATQTLQAYFSDQLFSHSHLGFILLDHQAKVVKITEVAANILGGNQEDYIDQNILTLFAQLPYDRQLVQKSFFEGVSVRNKAMSWNIGNIEYEILVDSFPIFNSQDQLLGVSVFIKDVTNLRSLENQIRRNDRLAMIGQIAAGTAHEIRNPLTSIKGFLQVVKKTLNEHELIKEIDFTNIMLEEVERINHLVGEFLLLSRSRDTKYDKICLNQLMKQFLPIVQNEALLKGIDIHYEAFTKAPEVLGAKELLKQVFLNICKNAIEAMGDRGDLKISYQLLVQEKMISIDFEDSGPGIPPYVLDKIFDPFFTTKEEGTGLGLSVCQRIIHDMGGKIWVSSKGFGTIFHIQIPYVTPS